MTFCYPDDSQIDCHNVTSLLMLYYQKSGGHFWTLNQKPVLAVPPDMELEDCGKPDKVHWWTCAKF